MSVPKACCCNQEFYPLITKTPLVFIISTCSTGCCKELVLASASLLSSQGNRNAYAAEGGRLWEPSCSSACTTSLQQACSHLPLDLGDRTAATGINRQAEAQQRAGILFSLYLLQPEGINCSSHSHDTEAAHFNRMFTESSTTALLSSLAGPLLQWPQQIFEVTVFYLCLSAFVQCNFKR